METSDDAANSRGGERRRRTQHYASRFSLSAPFSTTSVPPIVQMSPIVRHNSLHGSRQRPVWAPESLLFSYLFHIKGQLGEQAIILLAVRLRVAAHDQLLPRARGGGGAVPDVDGEGAGDVVCVGKERD